MRRDSVIKEIHIFETKDETNLNKQSICKGVLEEEVGTLIKWDLTADNVRETATTCHKYICAECISQFYGYFGTYS